MGHTVSLAYINGMIKYIDPQGEEPKGLNPQGEDLYTLNGKTKEEQFQRLYNFFKNRYKYIDIIFTYRNNASDFDRGRPLLNKEQVMNLIKSNKYFFRPRPNNITYGGYGKKKSRWNSGGGKKKRKSKTKKNKTKKNKTKKRKDKRRQYGGYDEFEEAMLNADKNSGIPTNLVLQS
jgi:hypothetical protein